MQQVGVGLDPRLAAIIDQNLQNYNGSQNRAIQSGPANASVSPNPQTSVSIDDPTGRPAPGSVSRPPSAFERGSNFMKNPKYRKRAAIAAGVVTAAAIVGSGRDRQQGTDRGRTSMYRY